MLQANSIAGSKLSSVFIVSLHRYSEACTVRRPRLIVTLAFSCLVSELHDVVQLK